MSMFSKGITKNVETVIAPTEKVRESLVRYGVKKDIEVIPTGINLDKFKKKNDAGRKISTQERTGNR